MVYAVQGFFGFRNAARRDGVMQNVRDTTYNGSHLGDTITTPINPSTRVVDPSMYVEVRFSTDAARDSFWADVIAFMGTGVNGPVVGSYIQQHDCSHDEGQVADCVIG